MEGFFEHQIFNMHFSPHGSLGQETHRISGVADRCPVVCEDFVRWVVEDPMVKLWGWMRMQAVGGGVMIWKPLYPFKKRGK